MLRLAKEVLTEAKLTDVSNLDPTNIVFVILGGLYYPLVDTILSLPVVQASFGSESQCDPGQKNHRVAALTLAQGENNPEPKERFSLPDHLRAEKKQVKSWGPCFRLISPLVQATSNLTFPPARRASRSARSVPGRQRRRSGHRCRAPSVSKGTGACRGPGRGRQWVVKIRAQNSSLVNR